MNLSDLKGIGPARRAALKEAGIENPEDLLTFFPTAYRDTSYSQPLDELKEGREACVEGVIDTSPKLQYMKGLTLVRANLRDDDCVVPMIWFNQPWMNKQLSKGESVVLYGRPTSYKGKLTLQNPVRVQERGILATYPKINGMSGKLISDTIRSLIESSDFERIIPETLPASLMKRYSLLNRQEAIRQAHFPTNRLSLSAAQKRIGFENMLLYQLAIRLAGGERAKGHAFNVSGENLSAFFSRLPFPPTAAQERVLGEILDDLRRGQMMNRLVQGDVGSGKTAVAFGAAYLAAQCGFQTALMAPTEILARQHLLTAEKVLKPMGIKSGLLLGGMKARERREALENIQSGEWQLVIGTHALLTPSVVFHNLGLAITDEQHRFGVRQRKQLGEQADKETEPHVLVLSATPIPRTLALILYGDLDVSILDVLPPGRQAVLTRIVPEQKRSEMYRYIREVAARGEQVYFVCPLVEESEMLEAKNAKQTLEELQNTHLTGLRIGISYGEQDAEEKQETLSRFAQGELDVLVATTVIEVGVDVPNATLMVIENAERFGLSQLHQLRGRVGRGNKQSWCFLLGSSNDRLKTMCDTNDGFVVAQKDLELRGPGEFLGTRQHGRLAPEAFGITDMGLIEETRSCVDLLLKSGDFAAEYEALSRLAKAKYEKALNEAVMN